MTVLNPAAQARRASEDFPRLRVGLVLRDHARRFSMALAKAINTAQPSRRPWRIRVALFLAVLLPTLSSADGQLPAPEDPLPLQRVAIPLSRLPEELERVRQGVLVKLPRAEFEALVRRAAQAGVLAKDVPRVLKSKYAAELIGDALTEGTGQWTVHGSRHGAAGLPLGNFNLALTGAHWASGTGTVLGLLDGKNLELWVEKSGDFLFEWSLRGSAAPGGRQFKLAVPPCTSGVLEIKADADRQIAVAKGGGLLSGPFDAGQPGKRLWRIEFSGRDKIEFLARWPAEASRQAPLLFAQLQVKQQITPERVAADYEFQIEALHAAVGELVFDVDASLKPLAVSCRTADLQDWNVRGAPPSSSQKPGEAAKKPSTLVVHLRTPVRGKLQGLKIRCLANNPVGQTWRSALVRLRAARLRGEGITVSVHPDIQLEDWQSGGFRLVSSSTESDGTQVLALVDPAPGFEPSRRPSCRFQSKGFNLATRQDAWWKINAKDSVLTADISYQIQRGSLFQLTLKLPSPRERWRVEAVDFEPKGALRSWAVTGPLLVVDLLRGLTPRNPGKLSVRLAERTEVARTRHLDLPTLEPVKSGTARGSLAVSLDSMYQAAIEQVSVPPANPPDDGPWRAQNLPPPRYYLAWRDQPVRGRLKLHALQPRVQVRCKQEVILSPGFGSIRARLDIEPLVGNATGLDLVITGPSDQPLSWKVDGGAKSVRSLERRALRDALPSLLLLSPIDPPRQASLAAMLPSAQHWRLRFAQPLTRPETIILRAPLAARQCVAGNPAAESDWSVPLVAIPDADCPVAEVTLEPSGVEIVHVETSGLQERTDAGLTDPKAPAAAGTLWHLGSLPRGVMPHLRLATRPSALPPPLDPWCDQACLETYVQACRPLLNRFRFQAHNWHSLDLPILLPASTKEIVAAKVDGHWLENLPQEQTGQGRQVRLPASMDRQGHAFEVYYLSDADWPSWPMLAEIDAPAPRLPVEPLSFERIWRLAPGLAPLDTRQLQTQAEPTGLGQELRRLWHAGDAALAPFLPAAGDDSLELQRQVLLGAESGLRHSLTKGISLGEALDRLAHDFIKEQLALVLDREALRAAEMAPGTPVALSPTPNAATGKPFWESMGLAYVPFSSGPVLTTRAQADQWLKTYGSSAELRRAMDSAVAEAVANEHDSAGRFVTLAAWLRTERQAEKAGAAEYLPSGAGWTTWRPSPGNPNAARLHVVQTASLLPAGLFIGIVSLALAWLIGCYRSRLGWVRFGMIWLLVAGLIWMRLPVGIQPMLLGAACVFALGYLLGAARCLLARPAPPERQHSSLAKILVGSSSVWLFCLPGAWAPEGRGEGSEAYQVFLVESEPGKQLALLSPDLLKKLTDLESRGAAPKGAVLVGARYQGQLKAGLAEFAMHFDVYSFADKTKILVPLADVDLREGTLLDGHAVFPVAVEGPKPGYLVDVVGKGRHDLILPATVRLTSVGGYQDLRFAGPRLCRNLFEWKMDGPVHGLQLLNSAGKIDMRQPTPASFEMKADLGTEAVVHLRWRVKEATAQSTVSEVHEAYYWDLRPGSTTLSSVLQFAPIKGSLASLVIALPENMEVRALEASAADANSATPGADILKKWSITGSGAERRLQIDLASPVAQRVLLKVDCVPRLNLAAHDILLELPVPLATRPTESFVAYRLDGLEASDRQRNLSVTSIGPEVFGKTWTDLGQREPGRITHAYSFRRTAARAGLRLLVSTPLPKLGGAVVWTVRADHADWAATLEVTAAQESLSLVEMTVPPNVTLADVRGPEVHHWSRHEALVQIWLEQPTKHANIQWRGWAPLARQATPSTPGAFALPLLTPARASIGAMRIRVAAGPGVSVTTERLRNLTKNADNSFTPANLAYEGVFQIRDLPVRPDVKILTLAEIQESAVVLVSHVDCRAARGDPGPLRIVMRHAGAWHVGLELAEPAPRVRHRRVGADQLWELRFPPGAAQPFSFRLRAAVPLKDLHSLPVPEISAPDASGLTSWFAVLGSQLRPETNKNLEKSATSSKELYCWPAEAQRIERDGKVWNVTSLDAPLRLEVRPGGQAPPMAMLLAQERAGLTGGSHWHHEAEFLLAARAGAEVQLVLPKDARLLAATLDGARAEPRFAGPQTCRLALGSQPGPRLLRVSWRFAAAAEPLEQPRIGGVYLAGITSPPRQGRIVVPAGQTLTARGTAATSSLMRQLLTRARAQLALTRTLLDPPTSDITPALVSAQKQFRWSAHQAEIQMAYLANEEKAKDAVALADMLKENGRLLRDRKLEGIKPPADIVPSDQPDWAAPLTAVPPWGRPVYWELADPSQAVTLSLTPEGNRWSRQRWSAAWIAAAIVLFGLSLFPGALVRIRAVLPEVWMLLAALGLLAWGISLPGLLVFALGGVARLLWLGHVLHRWAVPANS